MKSKYGQILKNEANKNGLENVIPRRSPVVVAVVVVVFVFMLAGVSFQIDAQSPNTGTPQTGAPSPAQRAFVQNGISVECSVDQLSPRKGDTTNLLAGTEAIVRVRIVDATEGKPVTNLHPSAWIDRREGGQI